MVVIVVFSMHVVLPEFHQLLYCGKYDVLCVTETWLHDGVNSGLLDPLCRFNIIRNDRDSGYGGVALLYL